MRRFLANLLSVVIMVVAVIGLMAAAVSHTAGNAGQAKQALKASGVYTTITPAALQSLRDTTVAGISLSDRAIQAAAEQAFTPDYLGQAVNPAIDNTYGWLNGQRAQPDFVIDLKEGRAAFGRNVGSVIADRADQLPTCTLAEAAELTRSLAVAIRSGEGVDSIPCRPPGVTRALIEQAVSRYVSTVALRNSALGDATIHARDITVQGQPFYEQARLRQLPSIVQTLHWLPWICLGLVLLLLLAIYRLVRSAHKTALRLAVSLVVGGLIACILALEARPIARLASTSLRNDSGEYAAVMHALGSAAVALGSALGGWLRGAGVITILIGAALLIVVQWRTWQRLPMKKPGHKPGTV